MVGHAGHRDGIVAGQHVHPDAFNPADMQAAGVKTANLIHHFSVHREAGFGKHGSVVARCAHRHDAVDIPKVISAVLDIGWAFHVAGERNFVPVRAVPAVHGDAV